jgi:hypothetical protein
MSQVDDILYAPISVKNRFLADFLIRRNSSGLYDWCALTDRAQMWLIKYNVVETTSWVGITTSWTGTWISSVSRHIIPYKVYERDDPAWYRNLIEENFVFEEVT